MIYGSNIPKKSSLKEIIYSSEARGSRSHQEYERIRM